MPSTSATATPRCDTSGTCTTTIENAPLGDPPAMTPFSHYLRKWDVASAGRVDSFVANSTTVAARIHRYYGANAEVVLPPVDVDAFAVAAASDIGEYYLMAGELVAYKRPDLAVTPSTR